MASIPGSANHYGLSQIHQLSDHLMMECIKTGDPTWRLGLLVGAVAPRRVGYERVYGFVDSAVGTPTGAGRSTTCRTIGLWNASAVNSARSVRSSSRNVKSPRNVSVF